MIQHLFQSRLTSSAGHLRNRFAAPLRSAKRRCPLRAYRMYLLNC